MELPDHLSASSINSFFQCPYKSLCRRLKRPTIPTDRKGADFGTAVHSVIPRYYDLIDDFPPAGELIDALEVTFSEGGNYATSKQKTKYERVKNHFMWFEQKRIEKKIKKPEFTEKQLRVKIVPNLPPFEMRLDAYFKDIKTVVDWKTGNSLEMDDSLIMQGLTYMLGLRSEGYEVEKVVFEDLAKGCEPPMPNVSSDFLISKAQRMCNMIKNNDFPQKPSYLCTKWCEYKLSCDMRYVCPWSNIC